MPRLLFLFHQDTIYILLSVQALGKGIKLHDDERVSILLYADDIVLLAENENDLQSMLNLLDTW